MPASVIRDVDTIHDIFVNQSQKLVDHSHHVTNNLLKASTNSDITFVIGGKVFSAHHIILAAQCEYTSPGMQWPVLSLLMMILSGDIVAPGVFICFTD